MNCRIPMPVRTSVNFDSYQLSIRQLHYSIHAVSRTWISWTRKHHLPVHDPLQLLRYSIQEARLYARNLSIGLASLAR